MQNKKYLELMNLLNLKLKTKNKLEKMFLQRYKEDLMKEYNKKANSTCNHDNYYHMDYFNQNSCDSINAEFRFIECSICHKKIILVKNKNKNWRFQIGNKIIHIVNKEKIKNLK